MYPSLYLVCRRRMSSVSIIVPGTQCPSMYGIGYPVLIILPGTQYPSLYLAPSIYHCLYLVSSAHNTTWYPVSIIVRTQCQVPIIVPGTQWRSLYLLSGDANLCQGWTRLPLSPLSPVQEDIWVARCKAKTQLEIYFTKQS